MAPSVPLPPPPAKPQLPPETHIAGEEPISFTTEDGVTIEALGAFPAGAQRAVILCHPHPLYGATMHNALIVVVARGLAALGNVGWVRFNYRGVGKSTGSYDSGRAEVGDARAAIAAARARLPQSSAAISVVGISFGTGVGYSAAVADTRVDRVALVAPLPRVLRHDLGRYPGPIEIVSASQDEFCTLDEAEGLARQLGDHVQFHVIEGADHQFIRFRRQVSTLVVPFVAPPA